jgi:putative ABC transport system permease protein
VIGVARDPKFGSFVDGTTGLHAYVPLQQQNLAGFEAYPFLIAARATHGGRLTGEIRGLISSLAPRLPIVSSQTAEEYAALGLVPQRLAASVSGSLGVVGLLLAGFGIYGLTAYTVACRTREIGIRLALGAQRANVVAMILRHGMLLTAIGAAVGVALAIAAGHVIAGLLFGVRPTDPVTLVGTAVLFVVIGLAACYGPVRRATRIGAVEALRHD